jgi:serine/threonine protein kinase
MATVYRARDERLKRDVALKLIAERFAHAPPFVHRFRREAELCASLGHPNIVAVLDAEAAAMRLPAVCGTPGYVAPEVLAGSAPSPQSDLYSLGALTYRLLAGPTGGAPGDAAATSALVTAAPARAPLAEACPDLPPGLTQAVEQAMARAPRARQPSAAEFRAQLVDAMTAPATHLELFARSSRTQRNGGVAGRSESHRTLIGRRFSSRERSTRHRKQLTMPPRFAGRPPIAARPPLARPS